MLYKVPVKAAQAVLLHPIHGDYGMRYTFPLQRVDGQFVFSRTAYDMYSKGQEVPEKV
jgi:hypothetical protein